MNYSTHAEDSPSLKIAVEIYMAPTRKTIRDILSRKESPVVFEEEIPRAATTLFRIKGYFFSIHLTITDAQSIEEDRLLGLNPFNFNLESVIQADIDPFLERNLQDIRDIINYIRDNKIPFYVSAYDTISFESKFLGSYDPATKNESIGDLAKLLR